MQQVFCQLTWLAGQNGLESVDVLEVTAVNQCPAGIDRVRNGIAEIVASAIDSSDSATFSQTAITRAPCSQYVEVFQSETDRIEAGVAGSAELCLRM